MKKHFTHLLPEQRQYHSEALRLYTAIAKHGAPQLATEIAFGADLPLEPSVAEKSAWVRHVIAMLEKHFDESAIKAIRMDCRCDHGMAERMQWVGRLYRECGDIETFAAREQAREAGLSVRDGVLHLQFPFCPCPMLEGVERLASKTWCQCTCGYSRDLFEHVLGCKVEVELLKSVKLGDDVCLMSIVPKP